MREARKLKCFYLTKDSIDLRFLSPNKFLLFRHVSLFIISLLLNTMDSNVLKAHLSFSLGAKSIRTRETNMADDDNRCGHEGCMCAVSGEQEYCSDHCRNADDQDITEISCDCGHSGCGIV